MEIRFTISLWQLNTLGFLGLIQFQTYLVPSCIFLFLIREVHNQPNREGSIFEHQTLARHLKLEMCMCVSVCMHCWYMQIYICVHICICVHIYFCHLSISIDITIDIDTDLCTYQDTEANIILIMFPLYKWENLKFTTFSRSTTFEQLK